jgi:hypothetical protein
MPESESFSNFRYLYVLHISVVVSRCEFIAEKNAPCFQVDDTLQDLSKQATQEGPGVLYMDSA